MTSTDIQDYHPSELQFDVVSDVTDCGRHPEDGETLEGMVFYVQATSPNGVRWVRHVGNVEWVSMDEEPFVYVKGVAAELMEKASKVANRLEAKANPHLNPDVWYYSGAMYGSDAYCALDLEADQLADEMRADLEGAW